MFQLSEQNLKLANVNVRTELHGDFRFECQDGGTVVTVRVE